MEVDDDCCGFGLTETMPNTSFDNTRDGSHDSCVLSAGPMNANTFDQSRTTLSVDSHDAVRAAAPVGNSETGQQPGHKRALIEPIATLRPSQTKADRKRAFAAARFYSECLMHGIRPTDADRAARDANQSYEKWWIAAAYHEEKPSVNNKRRKLDKLVSSSTSEVKEKRSAVLSCSEDESSLATDSKGYRNSELRFPVVTIDVLTGLSPTQVAEAKAGVVSTLQATGGDTTHPEFLSLATMLERYYSSRGWDQRWTSQDQSPLLMDGTWLTLSKPTYAGCAGKSARGDCIYSLGRLAFDMFRPTGLKCTIQASLNSIKPMSNHRNVYFPSSFRNEVASRQKKPELRKNE